MLVIIITSLCNVYSVRILIESLLLLLLLSHFSCVTLCDPMDCSPPGSSVHGILQARTLEWVAVPSSRGSSRSRDWTCTSYVFCIGRQVIYHQCCLGSPLNSIQRNQILINQMNTPQLVFLPKYILYPRNVALVLQAFTVLKCSHWLLVFTWLSGNFI